MKRSTGQFERRKHDLYETWDPRAVVPLLPHLATGTRFFEPCAGNGALIRQLVDRGLECVGALDIAPGTDVHYKPFTNATGDYWIGEGDASKLLISKHWTQGVDCFITNPPWTRDILHPIIFNLYWQRPTWLLFDADWMHTLQARPYLPLLRKVVSVGRVRWIEGSANDGKDNAAWHLFAPAGETQFIGRAA